MKFMESLDYIKVNGDIATFGITDQCQSMLGEITAIEIPEMDKEVEKGEELGSIESVNTADYLLAPVTGTIVEVNDKIQSNPGYLNSDPEGDGWIAKIKMSNPGELDYDDFMDKEAYMKYAEDESKAWAETPYSIQKYS